MDFLLVLVLNSISYGLLLFMLASGLTIVFSLMGVLNFAHASFYMLGAYFAYQISRWIGFWPALVLAPLGAGAVGALFERFALRRVHAFGHVPELLITFGLSYVLLFEAYWRGRVSVVSPLVATESLWGVGLAALLVRHTEGMGKRLALGALLVVAGGAVIGATR